jgi:hypothetical protein
VGREIPSGFCVTNHGDHFPDGISVPVLEDIRTSVEQQSRLLYQQAESFGAQMWLAKPAPQPSLPTSPKPLCSAVTDSLYAEGHRQWQCPDENCVQEHLTELRTEWLANGWPITSRSRTGRLNEAMLFECRDAIWVRHYGGLVYDTCERCGVKLIPVEDLSHYTCLQGRHPGFTFCMSHLRKYVRDGGDPCDAWLDSSNTCVYTKDFILAKDAQARIRPCRQGKERTSSTRIALPRPIFDDSQEGFIKRQRAREEQRHRA